MKKKFNILFSVALFVSLGPIALAQGTNSPSFGHPLGGVYLSGQETCWSSFPKAPVPGSAIDLGDLGITLSIQSSRNESQKAESFRDEKFSIRLVTDLIDPAFESKYPNTWKMLTKADHDANFITMFLKKKNARLRPYVQHPTLVMPLFTAGGFSYPSGHSSGTQLQALILASLFPDRADEFLSRARQVADSRVIAGVHYSSDTEAGLNLGELLFREFEANTKFQEDLSRAVKKDNLPDR